MKFLGNMCFKIILKVAKNQGFTLSLEGTFLEKPHGCQIDPRSHFKVKKKNKDITQLSRVQYGKYFLSFSYFATYFEINVLNLWFDFPVQTYFAVINFLARILMIETLYKFITIKR